MASKGENAEKIKASSYPSWYNSNKLVESTENNFLVYGAAISGDSASVIDKAMDRAGSELQSSVSDRLEDIRSEALVEQGSESGLDSSHFLIALRKADKAVPYLLEKQKEEVISVEGQESYRGFVQVSVSKEELIERIDKRLSGYDKAWKAMKTSKAFQNF
ncbi:hypothetical protein [Fodinibius salinus]|nr:hypothetical protein [Fodinibius salinus]